MPPDEALPITRQVWPDEHPASPRLAEDTSAIDFALQPARSDEGPTVALLGSYRLLAPYAERFGGRVRAAVQIVAIEATGGRVFHSNATRADAAPFRLPLRQPPAPPDPLGGVFAVAGHFNVALPEQLGLPGDEATYSVFVWLDELTSPVHVVRTPANPDRRALPAPAPPDQDIVRFETPRRCPRAARGGIGLGVAPPAPDGSQGPRLTGAADLAALRETALRLSAAPDHLVLLTLCASTRHLYAHTFPLPEAVRGPALGFEADPLRLIGPAEPAQRLFALAWLGGALSPVAAL